MTQAAGNKSRVRELLTVFIVMALFYGAPTLATVAYHFITEKTYASVIK